jgi:acetate kinase
MEAVSLRLKDGAIDAVVHRITHGGDKFTTPTQITDEVLHAIESLSALAPLHNPTAIATLRVARERFPQVPHIAVFDTAFHSALPSRAREYALPRDLAAKHGLRRFGFHGINYAHVSRVVAAHLRTTPQQLRLIVCHLGNGASVTPIEHGRSVETSMGMTPLEGLVWDLGPAISMQASCSTCYSRVNSTPSRLMIY